MPRGRFRRLCLLAGLALAAFGCAASSAAAKPGDILIADSDAAGSLGGAIFRLDPATGVVTGVAEGPQFGYPFALDFEPSGNLLVTDPGSTDEVFRVNPASGAVSTVASGAPFGDILGIAVAPNGHAYVTDDTVAPNGAIWDVNPATGDKTIFTDGSPFGDDPQGIDVNAAGQLFIGDYDGSAIYRIDPSGAKVPIATGGLLKEPELIALDPSGKLIVPDGGTPPAVHRVDRATGVVTPLASGAPLDFPFGADTLPNGDVVIADGDAGAILRISPSGAVTTIASGAPLGDPLDVAVEPPICHGKPATITGTDGADALGGSPFADVIASLGGNDRVQASGGRDTVCAGGGNDRVAGGKGKDRLFGEGGKDNLNGGKGKDKCVGGKGRDKGKGCEKGKL
jgi:streptogramin lyase